LPTWRANWKRTSNHSEQIVLEPFLKGLCEQVRRSMAGRQVDLVLLATPDVRVRMDREVLQKVVAGLIKNAVENTPDGGTIEVRAARQDENENLSP